MRYINKFAVWIPKSWYHKGQNTILWCQFFLCSNIFCHLCMNQKNLALRLCLLGFQLHYCNSFLRQLINIRFCFDFSHMIVWVKIFLFLWHCFHTNIYSRVEKDLICSFIFLRSNESKAYPLVVEDEVIDVYCHMTMASTSNGECGDGGWTLIMKIDGNQVADLHYLWLPSVFSFWF